MKKMKWKRIREDNEEEVLSFSLVVRGESQVPKVNATHMVKETQEKSELDLCLSHHVTYTSSLPEVKRN